MSAAAAAAQAKKKGVAGTRKTEDLLQAKITIAQGRRVSADQRLLDAQKGSLSGVQMFVGRQRANAAALMEERAA